MMDVKLAIEVVTAAIAIATIIYNAGQLKARLDRLEEIMLRGNAPLINQVENHEVRITTIEAICKERHELT